MFSNTGGSFSTSCSFIRTSTARPANQPGSTPRSFQFATNVNVAIEVTTMGPQEMRNRKYKLKCTKIQKQLKEMIFLNSALQAELNECRQRVERCSDERRFLLNRVLLFHNDKNKEANSRILQQALSKKQTTKTQTAISSSAFHSLPSSTTVTCTPTSTETNAQSSVNNVSHSTPPPAKRCKIDSSSKSK